MNRIGVAFRAFFAALGNRETAERVDAALEGKGLPAPQPAAPPTKKERAEIPPARSEALTLIAALQREARLLDFLFEPIDGYSDAQIGGAVREVHRLSRETLERFFAIEPVTDAAEGSEVNVTPEATGHTHRLIGNPSGDGPQAGELVHHGWRATKVNLPQWTGDASDALVIAPAEVQVR